MNNAVLAVLALIASVTAVYTDTPQKMVAIYEEAVLAAQMVSTAGDLRTMSVMLDADYLMNRHLPRENDFPRWLARTFKENNLKDLAVDHWGNPYVYRRYDGGRKYLLASLGPDLVPGTADDMVRTGP